MTDTPKFEVIDRRRMKAEEEQEASKTEASKTVEQEPTERGAGPRLVVSEGRREPEPAAPEAPAAVQEQEAEPDMPPAPTAEESLQQKAAYDASSQRLEDLVRAQNPAMGAPPQMNFEHLVQQFYVTAMIQMGAGAQEGQRPQVDILGARTTIDMLGVLAEKTRGNLSAVEDRAIQTVLFEARMAFLELTSMITLKGMQPPQTPGTL